MPSATRTEPGCASDGRPSGFRRERRVARSLLTDEGLAPLWSLLDSGRYEVRAPEEAALLCVAWLVRAGETGAAAALVEEIRPFAGEVRFAPHPADRPVPGPDAVHVRTAARIALPLAGLRLAAAVA
ncbi:hypothetical protein [Streptomyces nojiriensis]|uniref:hypothetical protein n=1 Tax=Streptomyces nojiriensis TaxID=66374 RepID=UPI0036B45844